MSIRSFSRSRRLPREKRPSLRLIARLLLAALFLLPLLWMLTAAVYPPGVPLPTTLQLLPENPTLQNFVRTFKVVSFARFIANSAAVTALAVPITLVSSSWAGLGMARLTIPSQRLWIILSLAILMVPGVALWSSRFILYNQIGWIDSFWALIAPAWMGTSPFYVLMFYRAFRRIPSAIYDAAQLDGAGVFQTWYLVGLPMARPTAVAVSLLSLVVYWGDYISPLLYLNSQSKYTLPVGLQLLQELNRSDWPLLMAACVVASAVPALFFILLQPYFARVVD